jgi:hypothetical protein
MAPAYDKCSAPAFSGKLAASDAVEVLASVSSLSFHAKRCRLWNHSFASRNCCQFYIKRQFYGFVALSKYLDFSEIGLADS